jgi:hypothetical protein
MNRSKNAGNYVKPPKNDNSKIVRSKELNALPIILKVADEIVRMENNLNFMDEDVKGKKQLEKSIERIRDTYKVSGIEIKEMLGLDYNEGMTVKVQNWIEDKNLTKDEQKITRIIKPQVNIKGQIFQTAEIEVTIGTKK